MAYYQHENEKHTNVAWFDETPVTWCIKRLRFVLTTNLNKSNKLLRPDDIVSFIPMEAVGENGGLRLDIEKQVSEIGDGYTYFEEHDVVVAKITPCFENAKGALAKGLKNGVGYGTTELYVLRPFTNITSEYLFYLTISYPFRKLGEAEMYGAGGQKRVPENFIKNFATAIPSLLEQKTITDFLDKKTTEIDVLIAKKYALIKLLEEKRIAFITQAVTKGLNKNTLMKDSYIPYIGKIPVHWGVKRFKFLVSEPFKYGANESAEDDDRSQPRYIRITDIKDNGLLKEDTFKSLSEEKAIPYLLKDGDILLARSGATVGKSFIYRAHLGRACYAGYLIRARIHSMINPEFIFRFLNSNSYWDWLNNIFIQATIQNVSAEKYANLCIPTPPLEEQEKILNVLDNKLKKIEETIFKITEAIGYLNEYRSTLITHAVTGKINVNSLLQEDTSEAKKEWALS
ncbi:restriction endonuclease subunit S [Legionella cincinnatiensis]|uniref:Type I restriction-modification system (Methylase S subunit) n=1 Tax=Legionella cincinnatiensis TaxID=28085 RepID=A0A378IN04_9GAMM|nr:restriction endonuclease subunit S [Legionella cincinnatiensis]KTC93381.1 putative type I restriction-modification system (methylase S subunit) [Legionella cincinnatiensis]STX36617.1 type I restriction-modification system (methylase_S) [Legionella cincinnatiensis]